MVCTLFSSLFYETALQGNSAAMNGLGFFYASGYGCIKNLKLSFEWSEKSALLGCSVSVKKKKEIFIYISSDFF